MEAAAALGQAARLGASIPCFAHSLRKHFYLQAKGKFLLLLFKKIDLV